MSANPLKPPPLYAEVRVGDCRELLAAMPAESVQTCVTSPPYWGLRDYGVDGQLGLERTPGDYVEKMVEVFRAVRRVLRPDGTLWLNLGDTYCAAPAGNKNRSASSGLTNPDRYLEKSVNPKINKRGTRNQRLANGRGDQPAVLRKKLLNESTRHELYRFRGKADGLKPKDLVGIPWRVALALQADGWWLRCDIIWSKPNPQPEAVKDRPTKAHEYVFLLSKSERYFYDAKAVAEPVSGNTHPRGAGVNPKATTSAPGSRQNASWSAAVRGLVETRNRRSVWTIPTQPFAGAHFACFPEELPRICVLASTRPGDLVLDPFAGSGTTGAAALKEQRRFVGCELNPAYAELAHKRMRGFTPNLLASVS